MYKITEVTHRVINFSGGKTSAYMTIKNYRQGDIVLFQDTGREHPKTYKFINDFEAFEKIPITRISYKDSDKPFAALLESRKYKVFPNRVKRICTVELKISTAKRYLRSIGVRKFENFIGFRADEPLRVARRKQKFKSVIDKFPLYDGGVTKEMVDRFWKSKPYTLEIPTILGNCTLCFMKGIPAILSILREFPELADEWIEDEENSKKFNGAKNGRTYFKGISIEQLRIIATNNLFKDYPLEDIRPQYSCECGV